MIKTLRRLNKIGTPKIVTVLDQRTLTLKTLSDIDFKEVEVICEPFGRNTAPSVALLCKALAQKNLNDRVVGIFPADQLVEDEKGFLKAVELGKKCALKGRVATIGIRPTSPATGFGYIEVTDSVTESDGSLKAFASRKFHEKPNIERAKEYQKSGKFFWNGGMFIFKVSTMIGHFKKLMPDMWKEIDKLKPNLSNLTDVYKSVEPISVDYGIMEKLENQIDCIPCDIGWSDVGSWQEVSRIIGDGKNPQVFQENSKGNFVYTSDSKKIVSFIDTSDLIVVDTSDALMISHKDSSQKVGAIVKQLDEVKHKSSTEHIFEFRPWGKFEILKDDDRFKVKVIRIEAGQQISYQSHAKRSEHWVLVEGSATVVLNDENILVKKGEHIMIPQGAKHRMRNTSATAVEFVEVQVGSYFGEDDIVRFQDDYGR